MKPKSPRGSRSPRRNIPEKAKVCFFCQNKVEPDYKEIETLKRFVTDRGKIASPDYSGVCSRHQRRLAKQIKRARFLALLPFLTQVKH